MSKYRILKVGELIQDGDEWIRERLRGGNWDNWTQTMNSGGRVHKNGPDIYRRLINKESETNEETNLPNSTDRGEASTDSSSDQPNRDRHITIDKSNYCWDGSVDLTKQHCISVSVEEV